MSLNASRANASESTNRYASGVTGESAPRYDTQPTSRTASHQLSPVVELNARRKTSTPPAVGPHQHFRKPAPRGTDNMDRLYGIRRPVTV